MNSEVKKQKRYSTAQLVPGDVVLVRNNTFQGKMKVKDQWGKVEYVMVRQVTDGVPTHEIRDEAGNVKTVHHNQLFLMSALLKAITPLGVGTSISPENIA